MNQKEAFVDGEGDRWYERNRSPGHDPVVPIIQRHGLSFSDVLEIGSSDGQRLLRLKTLYPEVRYKGVDPSQKAVDSADPRIDLRHAAADELPYAANEFDLVIFRFCLYLCDRAELFKIAAEQTGFCGWWNPDCL